MNTFTAVARGALAAVAVGMLVAGCAASGPARPQLSAEQRRQQAEDRAWAAEAFAKFAKSIEKHRSDGSLEPEALVTQLDAIIERDPTHLLARFNRGVLWQTLGYEADAYAAYQQLVGDDADFAPALENLAYQDVLKGRKQAAHAVYQRVVKRDPKSVTSRLALAGLAAEAGRYQEAIDLCRKALQRQADAVAAFRVLARSYLALGNLPMAELVLGRGLGIAKNDEDLHYLSAMILLRKGKLAEGVAKLKEVIKQQPSRLDARREFAEIALSYRDFGSAAQQYEAILKQQQMPTAAVLATGPALDPRGKKASAAEGGDGEAARQPVKPDLDTTEEGAGALARNIGVEPGDPALRIRLAVAYKGMGRFQEAQAVYQALANQGELSPAVHAALLWNWGVLEHRHLGAYEVAIEQYEALVDVLDDELGKPERDLVAKAQAAIVEASKQQRDAAAAAERQAREDKRLAALRVACDAVARSDYKGFKAKARAIGNEQERIQTAWQLMQEGQSVMQQGDLAGGEVQIKCALAVVPRSQRGKTEACAPMRVLWTQILYQLGRVQDAVEMIQGALRCDPENPDAQLIAGQLREILQQHGQEGQPGQPGQVR